MKTIREDPSGVFAQKKPIKAICREFGLIAEGRAQGDPVGGDRVPL